MRAIADRLRTPDLEYAHRLLRAWMHTLRDQLPVGQSKRLANQLPEPLRDSLLSPGRLEQTFEALPPQVRALVEPIGGLRRPTLDRDHRGTPDFGRTLRVTTRPSRPCDRGRPSDYRECDGEVL